MAPPSLRAFVLKAEIHNLNADTFEFRAQKTMYGGRLITAGDIVYLIATENAGGRGLFARGIVASATPVAKNPTLERQTPRVSVIIKRSAKVRTPLGRADLKPFSQWNDDQPQTELNFKLYRQATDKIVGINAATAAFLETHF